MFLIGVLLLVCFFLLRWKFKESDKLPVSDGQPLTDEQQKANYKSVRNFIERNPDLEINSKFPEYLEDIELTRRYKELNRQFDAGEIGYADYQIALNELNERMEQPTYKMLAYGKKIRIRP